MRLAIINVSSVASHPSRALFASLCAEGHTVFPVRPGIASIEGHAVYPTIAAVPSTLDGAILMVSPFLVERYLEDCALAGVRQIWLDGDVAAISPEMRSRLETLGLRSIVPLAGAPFVPRRSARKTLRRWLHLRAA